MMNTTRDFFEKEMNALEKALNSLNLSDPVPLHLLREELYLIRGCQQRVQAFVAEHPFADEGSEIEYHKLLYPRLGALHVFRVEVYLLTKDLPPVSAMQPAYYAEQFQLIFAYIRRYQFLYTYFKLNADELDRLYFTTAANRESVLLPVLADPETGHTTQTGYLFARFRAYELLFNYIVRQSADTKHPFRWTGETVNLIELLHGIHLNGQVNDGQVGIVEFFNGMGAFFGLDLGVPKKGLEALMKRKKLSKTHFTDRMQSSLNDRMDQEFDLEREKRRKQKGAY